MHNVQQAAFTYHFSLAVSALIGAAASVHAAEPLKVGFVYIGPASGAGWSYAHELGRQEVQRSFGDKVKTVFVENVAEGPDAERVIRDLAANGAKVIFGGAFGYMNAMAKVAPEFPEVRSNMPLVTRLVAISASTISARMKAPV